MTSSRAPLRTLSLFLLALAALSPATAQAQACTDCDGGMDAMVPTDAAISQATALDGSLEAGGSVDGGSGDAAITTAVVVGLDGSLADAGKGTNQSGVTWVHEGCSLGSATAGRHSALAYAGVLLAMTLLLRRRRARSLL